MAIDFDKSGRIVGQDAFVDFLSLLTNAQKQCYVFLNCNTKGAGNTGKHMQNERSFLIWCIGTSLILWAVTASAGADRTVVDGLGRTIHVPAKVDRAICSGPGCLRLLTYLQGQDFVVAVDDIEVRREQFDARPYAMANPQFKELPVFGEFRGFDNPEQILSLKIQPQVIFKTYPTMGYDPVELQAKTGIPVIALTYGDLAGKKEQFYSALRTMGEVVGREDRAGEVISFFETTIDELADLTRDLPENDRPSAGKRDTLLRCGK